MVATENVGHLALFVEAKTGIRAINELKPVLRFELTATPFVETSRGAVQFKNVIYDYPLARAMADGFVKEPAVVTSKTSILASSLLHSLKRSNCKMASGCTRTLRSSWRPMPANGAAHHKAISAGDRP